MFEIDYILSEIYLRFVSLISFLFWQATNNLFSNWKVKSFWKSILKDTFLFTSVFVMFCAIWYDLYNLKHGRKTYGGVLLLVKLLPATLQKLMYKLNVKSRNATYLWMYLIKSVTCTYSVVLFKPILWENELGKAIAIFSGN